MGHGPVTGFNNTPFPEHLGADAWGRPGVGGMPGNPVDPPARLRHWTAPHRHTRLLKVHNQVEFVRKGHGSGRRDDKARYWTFIQLDDIAPRRQNSLERGNFQRAHASFRAAGDAWVAVR